MPWHRDLNATIERIQTRAVAFIFERVIVSPFWKLKGYRRTGGNLDSIKNRGANRRHQSMMISPRRAA
jgi:hypothetical protein